MSDFIKACDVINSCKTSAQNNNAFAYVLLYEKEMYRRSKLTIQDSFRDSLLSAKQIEKDVEALHAMLDENLLNLC